jgi:thiamine phosphate synthase YjbQ (UPF0047 family)
MRELPQFYLHFHQSSSGHRDDESGLHHDYEQCLEKLTPFYASGDVYHHNRTGEDNADGHMKRQILGREVMVVITNERLDFGP